MSRKAGFRWIAGGAYARIRVGRGRRISVPITGCGADEDAIDARVALVGAQVDRLVKAGRADLAKGFADQIGAAKGPRDLAIVDKAISRSIAQSAPIAAGEATVSDIGKLWVSGELSRQHPDYIRKKTSADRDEQILRIYVYPTMRDIPIRAVIRDDIKLVMSRIPEFDPRTGKPIAVATRRHVAQVMSRLFAMCVMPLEIIENSPVPKGFLPRLGHGKAKNYLYPDEERRLLQCEEIPVLFRVFYGVIAREGMRFSEARLLGWPEVDLSRGLLRLDKNKTDDPRAWVVDPSTARALTAWCAMNPKSAGPFVDIPDDENQAARFRRHLLQAGIDREELHTATAERTRIRVHDLRATFVTVSLANGQSETWVADRTGHKSSTMIARYKRAARTLEELGLGPLHPLDEALWKPESAPDTGGVIVGQSGNGTDGGASLDAPEVVAMIESTEGGTRTLTPFRTADFESDPRAPYASHGLKNGSPGTGATYGDTIDPPIAPFGGSENGSNGDGSGGSLRARANARKRTRHDAEILTGFSRAVELALARDEVGTHTQMRTLAAALGGAS